jgi:hypothetical protein
MIPPSPQAGPVDIRGLLVEVQRLTDTELSASHRKAILQRVAGLGKGDFEALVSLVEEDSDDLSARLCISRAALIEGLVSGLPSPERGETEPGVGRVWLLAFVAWVAESHAAPYLPQSAQIGVWPYVLRHDHVTGAFRTLFAPPRHDRHAYDFWETLNLTTLQFHASDPTSFSLLVEKKTADIGDQPVLLKCLQLRFATNHPERKKSRSAFAEFQARDPQNVYADAQPDIYASTDHWVAMEFISARADILLGDVHRLIGANLASAANKAVLAQLAELDKGGFRALVSLVEEEAGSVLARISDTRTALIDGLVKTLPTPDQVESGPGVGRVWMLAFIAWVAENRAASPVLPPDHTDIFRFALRYRHITDAFRTLYAPEDDTPAAKFWNGLNLSTLRFHAFGTTSFILAVEQTASPQLVALKCLQLRFAPHHEVRRAAEKALAKFEAYQPGVVEARVVPAVYASTDHWVAMEFISGPTLREWLDSWTSVLVASSGKEKKRSKGATKEEARKALLREKWPVIEVLRHVASPLAQSLACIHHYGLYHADLTPRNVILEGEPQELLPTSITTTPPEALNSSLKRITRARLVDLGPNFALSGLVDAPYPETAFLAESEDPSIRSDLYSLGRVVRALAGPADTSGSAIRLAVYRDHPMLGRFLDDLLDRNPRRRLLLDWAPGAAAVDTERTDQELSASLAERLRSVIEQEAKFTWEPNKLTRVVGFKWYGGKLLREWWWERKLKRESKGPSPLPDGTPANKCPPNRSEGSPLPSVVLGTSIARLAIWAALSGLAGALGIMIAIGGLIADLPVRSPFQRQLFGFLASVSLGSIRGPAAPIGALRLNEPAHWVGFSFAVAALGYYQVLYAFVGPFSAAGRRSAYGRRTVAGLSRIWTVLVLLLVLVANVFKPTWWIGLSALGVGLLSVTNVTCWRFESRVWRAAKRDLGMSDSDELEFRDPTRDFYFNWGVTSAGYFAALIVLFLLQMKGRLHDVGLYEAVIFGVNLIILYYNSVLRLGLTVRARLTRAFALEERLTLARNLGLCGEPRSRERKASDGNDLLTPT